MNIGCTKDARLNVSKELAKAMGAGSLVVRVQEYARCLRDGQDMRKGDEIYGMLIESVVVRLQCLHLPVSKT